MFCFWEGNDEEWCSHCDFSGFQRYDQSYLLYKKEKLFENSQISSQTYLNFGIGCVKITAYEKPVRQDF